MRIVLLRPQSCLRRAGERRAVAALVLPLVVGEDGRGEAMGDGSLGDVAPLRARADRDARTVRPYRADGGERLGLDDYFFGDGISMIEWADKFPELIPERAQWILFETKSENERLIEAT